MALSTGIRNPEINLGLKLIKVQLARNILAQSYFSFWRVWAEITGEL